MKRPILGAVLCGGKSSRMGSDKASIQVRSGVSQLDYQLGLLEPFCGSLAVCVGPPSQFERELPAGVAMVFDDDAVAGPMAGVIAALRHADGLPVLAVACDMPYLETSHLVQLLNRRDLDRWATCFVASDGRPDPMCSIYESAALAELESMASSGKASLRFFLSGAGIERVEVADGRFLASVNDLAALERARRELGSD